MNFTKIDPADLNFLRRELSNGGLGIVEALMVCWQSIFSCACTGGPIQLYRVSPTKLSEIKVWFWTITVLTYKSIIYLGTFTLKLFSWRVSFHCQVVKKSWHAACNLRSSRPLFKGRLSYAYWETQHFRPQLNLDFDLCHFLGMKVPPTLKMKAFFPRPLVSGRLLAFFKKMKKEFHSPTKVQQWQKIVRKNCGLYPSQQQWKRP